MELFDIVRISNEYGKNPELVLGGGGNTSKKDGRVLYIKSSGTALATIEEAGFVPLSRRALEETLTKAYPADDRGREAAFLHDVMAGRTIPGETRRPSVEALLHSLFPQKYVMHLHPALVNGLTCGKDGAERAKALFGDRAIWIPSTRPGLVLGKRCHSALEAYSEKREEDAGLVLLENHGIFVAADTEEGLRALIEGTVATLKSAVTSFPDEMRPETPQAGWAEAIRKHTGAAHVRFCATPQILAYLQSEAAASDLLKPFTPDQIVYCGANPVYVTSIEALKDVSPKGRVILVEQAGMFAIGQREKEAELAALLFIDAIKIAVYARSFGGAQHLADDLIQFIATWEAEAYRQKEAGKCMISGIQGRSD